MAYMSTDNTTSLIEQITQALAEGRNKRVRKLVRKMHPAKVAALLEQLNSEQRLLLWQQVDAVNERRVLAHLNAHFRDELVAQEESELPGTAVPDDSGLADNNPRSELAAVRGALEAGRLKRVGKLLNRMHPAKVAGLLEALPPVERADAWSMVETERAGRVLTFLHNEISVALARQLDPEDLVAAAQPLELDDLVDLIQILPGALGDHLVRSTVGVRRTRLESMLSFPRETAGGLMNADPIAVRANVKVGAVLRYLRLLEKLPEHTDMLMVIDRGGRYQGALPLSSLVTAHLDAQVSALMLPDVRGINVHTSNREVARIFQDEDLLSAPVVDDGMLLIGRITVDDVVDLIRDESERSVMSSAGLDEEADMFAPVLVSSRRRAVWLSVNLMAAFLAAWVIGQFQGTLEQLVALAVLMPIVSSMGGIAGSQTLTLMIRGLSLNQIQPGNLRVLLGRELGISLINGALSAAVVGALSIAWFGNWGIGGVIAIALLLNLVCAALAGLFIPLVLKRAGIDPALAGGVVLTTVTDVVGFLTFLGLATWLLV